ncbi:MAG: CoA transferase [Betaproteobacteria bacterium]|nr:MAG: CoA transferase [Betaproteobacteria bacterium]
MNVLHSIRVIDLGNFITAPYAAMLLAELGADVVKVERPGTGDPFRSFEGGLYSPHFQSYNRHKRSLALDYSKPEGLEILHKLVSNADVVILNNRPGVSEKLGVDYDRLHGVNQRLVYCSITGFGFDGPYASRPAYDNVGQTLSGWLSLFHDGSDPRVAGPAVSDALTGLFACLGILAALFDREKSGVGRRVDTSMLEATMAFGAEPIGQYLATGQAPTQYSRGATSQAYLLECRDGKRIGLQLSSPNKFWESLAKAIERPDFLQKYPDRRARISRYEDIAKELAGIFRKRNRDEWMQVLEANDVPFAPERRVNELFDDPQVRHLNLLFKSLHGVHGEVRGMRRPLRFDGEREAQLRPPPDLGEHTDEVLQELGISVDRRKDLRGRALI